MARPYYDYNNRSTFRHVLKNRLRNKLSMLVKKVWYDDLLCITIFKTLFFHAGLWPADDHPSRCGFWFRYWHPRLALATTCFLLFIFIPITMYEARNDTLLVFLEPFAFSFIAGMLTIHLACFTANSADFKLTLQSLQTARDYCSELPEPPKAVTKRNRKLSLFVIFYAGLCLWNVTLFSFGLPWTLFPKRKQPTVIWYPYDGYASPYYEITLLGWASILFTGGCIISLVNSLFMALMVQAIRHLEILNYHILQLRPTTHHYRKKGELRKHRTKPFTLKTKKPMQIGSCQHYTVISPKSIQPKKRKEFIQAQYSDFEMRMAIRKCARHHQAIERFVRNVNRVYWPVIAAQYTCSVVPTFLAIILVTQSPTLDIRILMFIALIVMCNFSLSIFSRLANEITIQSSLVKDAVFGCDWITASDGFKRSMRLMIMMSNKPLVINFAGNFNMSMETFLAVMKLTYSYYMAAVATVRRKNVGEKITYMAMSEIL